jgi:DNA-binding response OmpR family regulator
MTNEVRHFYAFGPFRLDSAKRVLLRDDKPVPLAPKPLDTLLVLVENAAQRVAPRRPAAVYGFPEALSLTRSSLHTARLSLTRDLPAC